MTIGPGSSALPGVKPADRLDRYAHEFDTVELNNTENQFLIFEIFDAKGGFIKQLFRGMVINGKNEFSFSTSSLSTGNYLIRIANGRGENIAVKKFVKQ